MSNQDTACQQCGIFPICFSINLNQDELQQIDEIVETQKILQKNDVLFKQSDPFAGIFILRSGTIKVVEVTEKGIERIIAFYFPGDIFGFDAAEGREHLYTAIALETVSVCELSPKKLFELASKLPVLQYHLFKLMSRELSHQTQINLNTTAEQRLCKFLLNMSENLKRRHLISDKLHLSMSREEIGEYLGLAAETVSRLFKRLEEDKVIEVNHRDITILDRHALKKHEQGSV